MAEIILDVKGLKCPLPVLKLKKAIKALAEGDVLEVHATDALSVIDVPAYCNESGNRLLSVRGDGAVHIFRIERA